MSIKDFSDRDLFAEFARRMRCADKPSQRMVFLGAPGSGKGTQAPILAEDNCWCQISTGDMLRDAVSRGTPLGKQAKTIMDRGDLVPDDLVIGLINDKIKTPECRRGFILDGFPRTEEQAKALDRLMADQQTKIDRVYELNVPDELLTERMTGRRVHKPSGRTYHVKFNPPKVQDKDDVTGEPLIQRSDDKEDVIKNRLVQYHKMTVPLINYYRNQSKLVTIDATKNIKDITDQLKRSI